MRVGLETPCVWIHPTARGICAAALVDTKGILTSLEDEQARPPPPRSVCIFMCSISPLIYACTKNLIEKCKAGIRICEFFLLRIEYSYVIVDEYVVGIFLRTNHKKPVKGEQTVIVKSCTHFF